MADQLCSVLKSIINSHSHTFEFESTLDHGPDEGELTDEIEDENAEDEELLDLDYFSKENEDRILLNKFSIEYMALAINFYDEANPKINVGFF